MALMGEMRRNDLLQVLREKGASAPVTQPAPAVCCIMLMTVPCAQCYVPFHRWNTQAPEVICPSLDTVVEPDIQAQLAHRLCDFGHVTTAHGVPGSSCWQPGAQCLGRNPALPVPACDLAKVRGPFRGRGSGHGCPTGGIGQHVPGAQDGRPHRKQSAPAADAAIPATGDKDGRKL